MKKIILIISMISLLLLPLVTAESPPLEGEIEKLSKGLVGHNIPGPAKILFGNEKVMVHIKKNSGETLQVGLVIANGKITKLNTEPLENPTIQAYLTEGLILELQDAPNPTERLKQAISSKEITFKTASYWDSFKLKFLTLALKLA